MRGLAGGVGFRARLLALHVMLRNRCDPHHARVLLGSPRSGTTWLGHVLAAVSGAAPLFEPLHLTGVPAARRAGFRWRTYLPPGAEWPAGKAYLDRVFRGQVLNAWTVQDMSLRQARRARFMLVKFAGANRLLPWLCETFPIAPPILIVRHPCAVVASQMRHGAWRDTPRPDARSVCPDLPGLAPLLAALETPEEFLAATWALDQYIPLSSTPPHRWTLVTYEALSENGGAELERILAPWGVKVNAEMRARLSVPSRTVAANGMAGVSGWKRQLSPSQIGRILAVTARFGLDFYGDDPAPDLLRLHGVQPRLTQPEPA